MIRIGWMMHAVILGVKVDECARCHHVGPHLLLRKTHWFTVFGVPVVLLWIQHGMLCAECGEYTGLAYGTVRRGMKAGRLPLDRERPAFEQAVREHLGTAPEDWRAFGVEPGASAEALHARYRVLAKQLHPDAGGDQKRFAAMSLLYRKLLTTPAVETPETIDGAELFDPVVLNPHRGPFDFYAKVWPVLAAAILLFALATSQPAPPMTSAVNNPGVATAAPFAPAVVGDAHRCWINYRGIAGCSTIDGSAMLFGTATGTPETCYFTEPLLEGQSARCHP